MSKNIGIVGCGFAGLHLALLLQQNQIDVTLYTDRTAEQVYAGNPALLARWSHTLERERALDINLWDDAQSEFYRFNFYVNGPQPLQFTGELNSPASFIDPRVYLSRLQEVFAARGGRIVYAPISSNDLPTLSEDHDLMVVASGRGSMVEMFPRLPEYSPFSTPVRNLNIAYFDGFTSPDEDGVQFVLSPGHGEIIQGTIYSFKRFVQGILFEGIPGGDFDRLSAVRYAENPAKFIETAKDILRQHAPHLYARIDHDRFDVVSSGDVLQGAFAPTVRRAYAPLVNGKYAIAVGDVHVLNDPLLAQGANTASQSAWTLGHLIMENDQFDEAFCQQAEADMWDYAQHVVKWSNRMLMPPEAHVLDLIVNSAHNPALASAFANTFHQPRQAEVLENAEHTHAMMASLAAV